MIRFNVELALDSPEYVGGSLHPKMVRVEDYVFGHPEVDSSL